MDNLYRGAVQSSEYIRLQDWQRTASCSSGTSLELQREPKQPSSELFGLERDYIYFHAIVRDVHDRSGRETKSRGWRLERGAR